MQQSYRRSNNSISELKSDKCITKTRSTGTLHTSAKARLTSTMISVPPSGESFGILQLNNNRCRHVADQDK